MNDPVVVTDRMRLGYALWFTMAFLVIWSVFVLNETLIWVEETRCASQINAWAAWDFHLSIFAWRLGICGTTP